MSSGNNNGNEDPNVIRLRVENAKNLTKEGQISEMKRIHGFPWQFQVYRHSIISCITVRIMNMKSVECPNFECWIEGEIKLINHMDDAKSEKEDIVKLFNVDKCFEVTYFTSFNRVISDPEEGMLLEFVVDGDIVIEVKIDVKGINGDRFRKWSPIDFFCPSKYSDAILIVEGKKLHVSKQILANSSKYFENMFFDDADESQKEFELKDISFDGFLSALELIYDSKRNLNESNMESLLMIADRFEIPKIVNICEGVLITPTILPVHFRLRLSDLYNMPMAKLRAYLDANEVGEMADVKKSDSYTQYSEEMKAELKLIEDRTDEDSKEERAARYLDKFQDMGCRELPQANFFSPSKSTDVILIVEGKKLHVSKQILAHFSPYYEDLFFGEFKETKHNEITLDDVPYEIFVTVLGMICDCGKSADDPYPVDDCNVQIFLEIADRFDIAKVLMMCETILMKSSCLPLHRLLLLSEKYNLLALQAKCLREVKYVEDVIDVEHSRSYTHFSTELKDDLRKKLLMLHKMNRRRPRDEECSIQ